MRQNNNFEKNWPEKNLTLDCLLRTIPPIIESQHGIVAYVIYTLLLEKKTKTQGIIVQHCTSS